MNEFQIFSNSSLHYGGLSRILFLAPLGGVAQLGERLTGSQEVRGSIPLVSTQESKSLRVSSEAFFIHGVIRACGATVSAGDS